MSSLTIEDPALARRSDLDALRAVAMLLGIVLHASLSFFPFPWVVTDRQQNPAIGFVFSAIHGFRMPLFFVMSGFFSAMLLHRRGRRALVKHRFFRVFLPLLLGMVTIVPATFWISSVAMSSGSGKPVGVAPAGGVPDIWEAAATGDLGVIERHLANGADVNGRGGKYRSTALQRAALAGREEAAELLIRRGADVNALEGDQSTPLHSAALLGHEKVVHVLVQNGADVNAANSRGETPLGAATLDGGTVRFIASMIEIELDEGLGSRRASIAEYLRQRGATAGRKAGVADMLMQIPLFNHLWFLWFLWWLVLGLAAVSAVGAWLPPIRLPAWMVLSRARWLWLVPLTMFPQAFIPTAGTLLAFGPDGSSGLLPIPHVLAYYAIFFGFGALYYGYDDRSDQVGERWWLPLSIALLVVFPLGMVLAERGPELLNVGLSPLLGRVFTIFLQAAYPWLMTFGLMGLFRRFCPAESPTMRYLSDSAYWLYLAHLPLIIAAQSVVRDWPLPAFAKFLLIVAVVTSFLLWTYQTLVRYTWLGRFLNGPRVRPARAGAPAVVA
jgi:hypothetical protein